MNSIFGEPPAKHLQALMEMMKQIQRGQDELRHVVKELQQQMSMKEEEDEEDIELIDLDEILEESYMLRDGGGRALSSKLQMLGDEIISMWEQVIERYNLGIITHNETTHRLRELCELWLLRNGIERVEDDAEFIKRQNWLIGHILIKRQWLNKTTQNHLISKEDDIWPPICAGIIHTPRELQILDYLAINQKRDVTLIYRQLGSVLAPPRPGTRITSEIDELKVLHDITLPAPIQCEWYQYAEFDHYAVIETEDSEQIKDAYGRFQRLYNNQFIDEYGEEVLCPISKEPIVNGTLLRCGHMFETDMLREHWNATRNANRKTNKWTGVQCPCCRANINRIRVEGCDFN